MCGVSVVSGGEETWFICVAFDYLGTCSVGQGGLELTVVVYF